MTWERVAIGAAKCGLERFSGRPSHLATSTSLAWSLASTHPPTQSVVRCIESVDVVQEALQSLKRPVLLHRSSYTQVFRLRKSLLLPDQR